MRLSVFRSSKYIYAQIIDDEKGATLVSFSDKNLKFSEKLTKVQKAATTGEELAKRALKKKIKKVVFDRGRYKYHGRVRALAEGARKGGLVF
ncbi:50S ribosomal protein L18 [Candidatus Woesebacteria bacterium]|nr:50S ribosomal protein L18 [Candidatus Woesebacteria bacterium]